MFRLRIVNSSEEQRDFITTQGTESRRLPLDTSGQFCMTNLDQRSTGVTGTIPGQVEFPVELIRVQNLVAIVGDYKDPCFLPVFIQNSFCI